MVKGLELLIALEDPFHSEVVCKLNWGGLITHKQVLHQIWIWLALHHCETLEASAFIH